MHIQMARKTGSPRQQSEHKCPHCDFTSKKNAHFILHVKDKHDTEI